MRTQSEKERLEQYFQNVLKYLPGGVAVVRYEPDGRMIPEFLSEGFAEMTKMTKEEAWAIYKKDAMAGVHPDDRAFVNRRMEEYMAAGGVSALKEALFAVTPEAVIAEVEFSGLRGRGGGGFPAGRKWRQVAAHKEEPLKYIVCNGDEGDPGAFMD